jgi:hypothetical protein
MKGGVWEGERSTSPIRLQAMGVLTTHKLADNEEEMN